MARHRKSEHIALLLLFLLLPVAAAGLQNGVETRFDSADPSLSPYSIRLFIPESGSIHSTQINDMINGLHGDVVIGTSFGLSMFNGTWSTRHINRENISEGLMDEYISAIEYDHRGDLWIGYSGGIQIYNGVYYQSIRDQQLFKDPRIKDLQRWGDDIWIATGTAGIHRYREGKWTWFQPMSDTGPGFFEIDSMILDSASNALIIATDHEGLWMARSPDDPVIFEVLEPAGGTYGSLKHVRRDPLGGAYFFDSAGVAHYSVNDGFRSVLTVSDLSNANIDINDVSAASDGKIYLATDNGIYVWYNGKVIRQLSRFEGIGTSQIVQYIFVAPGNRVWFATQEYVGYYQENQNSGYQIPVEMVTTVGPGTMSWTIALSAGPTPTPGESTQVCGTGPEPGLLSQLIDPVVSAINSLTSHLGFSLFGSPAQNSCLLP